MTAAAEPSRDRPVDATTTTAWNRLRDLAEAAQVRGRVDLL